MLNARPSGELIMVSNIVEDVNGPANSGFGLMISNVGPTSLRPEIRLEAVFNYAANKA